jgi:hypothetical protein
LARFKRKIAWSRRSFFGGLRFGVLGFGIQERDLRYHDIINILSSLYIFHPSLQNRSVISHILELIFRWVRRAIARRRKNIGDIYKFVMTLLLQTTAYRHILHRNDQKTWPATPKPKYPNTPNKYTINKQSKFYK